jgi:tRNA A-37 threonylcarbamoyl transferase component Bud32
LIKEEPELAVKERKKILRRVGEAVEELHAKDWIHIGTLSRQSGPRQS